MCIRLMNKVDLPIWAYTFFGLCFFTFFIYFATWYVRELRIHPGPPALDISEINNKNIPNNTPSESNQLPEGKNDYDPKLSDPKIFNNMNISSIFPVKNKNLVYYLKNGNIWFVNLNNTPLLPQLFLDNDFDILYFTINADLDKIAYSVLLNTPNPGDEEEFFEQNGDTVYLKNLKNNMEEIVYNIKKPQDMYVRDLKFSENSNTLFVTNNSLNVIDLSSKKVKTFLTKESDNFCNLYFIDDISLDDKKVLVTLGCYEGSSQMVFDLVSEKVTAKINNGYTTGGVSAYGFVDNQRLLGQTADDNREKSKIAIFDTKWNITKNILTLDDYAFRLTNIANNQQNKFAIKDIYTKTETGSLEIFGFDVFKFDYSNLNLVKTEEPKDLIISTRVYRDDQGEYLKNDREIISLWKNDTTLKNPSLLDTLDDTKSGSRFVVVTN